MHSPGQTSKSITRVVLVTGPSGAGRGTAIRVFEDLGYEPIDNLPLGLVPRLFDGPPMRRPIALGVDVRNRDFSASGLIALMDELEQNPAISVELLFLDCRPAELLRRYGETRRRHPVTTSPTPEHAVLAEIALLAPIRERAGILIDTTRLSPRDLRGEIARFFAPQDGAGLVVSVQSFSYKRGAPSGLDMMFDCRFLKNPHWDAGLRPLDGRSPVVAAHIESDPLLPGFFERAYELLLFLLPAQVEEGKSHLAIGFGCTGGQHRSVFVAETMAKALAAQGWQVSIRHRELDRRMMTASMNVEGGD